jgi:hypothetical protein
MGVGGDEPDPCCPSQAEWQHDGPMKATVPTVSLTVIQKTSLRVGSRASCALMKSRSS